jgi:hypothetical protein
MPTRRNVAAAVVAIGLASTTGASAQPVVPSPALAEVRRELEAFRTELKRAAEMRDIGKLRVLLTDTFTHTHASGRTEDKAARMIALAAREPAI